MWQWRPDEFCEVKQRSPRRNSGNKRPTSTIKLSKVDHLRIPAKIESENS